MRRCARPPRNRRSRVSFQGRSSRQPLSDKASVSRRRQVHRRGTRRVRLRRRKPDLYAKVVLTLIMLMLALDACNQYVHPTTVVAALCPFAGAQFSSAGGLRSFDTRTGNLWMRDDGGRSHGKISEAGGSPQRDQQSCVSVSMGVHCGTHQKKPVLFSDEIGCIVCIKCRNVCSLLIAPGGGGSPSSVTSIEVRSTPSKSSAVRFCVWRVGSPARRALRTHLACLTPPVCQKLSRWAFRTGPLSPSSTKPQTVCGTALSSPRVGTGVCLPTSNANFDP